MLSAVVAATFWFSLTLAALSLDNGTVPYTALSLPDPSNWKTKTNAGGGSLIETLYKPYNQYNASGWTRYMLAECESWGGGTCVGYSELTTGAYNTEQPYRIWWGIVYGEGVKLGLGDFRRDVSENDQIQDTFALVTRDSGTGTISSTASSMSTGAGSMSTTGTSAPSSLHAAQSTSVSPATSTGAGYQTQPNDFVPIGIALLMAAAM